MILPQRLTQQHTLEEYTIDDCRDDQKEVLSYILQYFKTWHELEKTPESIKAFKPLRMTLCGVAGSGKSTLINTHVTAIRKITQKTNSVYVCGPTGSAAFNAGGETCNRLFGMKTRLQESNLSANALKTLVVNCKILLPSLWMKGVWYLLYCWEQWKIIADKLPSEEPTKV